MDRFENFRGIIATDPVIKARFEEGAVKLAASAAGLLDIKVDPEDMIQIDALRLCAITGDEIDHDRALVELNRLSTVRGLLDERDRADRIRNGDSEEIEKLNKLPRATRMARARDLGINDLIPKKESTSIADNATIYKQAMAMRPADRMSFMRKHGLA